MRRLGILIVALYSYLSAIAQPTCNFTHYTSRDGFSQNTTMSIIQDSKGYMWFATWDGLCRFDGYDFKTYKAKPGDSIQVSNSRIDHIVEDVNGYIWILAYGKDVYRFNPANERMINVPPLDSSFNKSKLPIEKIVCLDNGAVWLLSEKDGGIRISSQSIGGKVQYQLYASKNRLLESDVIYNVHLDNEGNEWLLTANGISVLKKNSITPEKYLFENGGSELTKIQSFFALHEEDDEIWLGSIKGRIWRYKKKGGRFELFELPLNSNVGSIEVLPNGNYFVTTHNKGICIVDDSSNQITLLTKENGALKSNVVFETYRTKNGDIWFQQNYNGISQYRYNDNKVVEHTVTYGNEVNYLAKPEFFISEDENGYLWVHPHGGGFSFYDSNVGKLIPFYNDASSSKVLFSRYLHSMCSDKQGNLWFCSRSKGMEKVTFPKNNFTSVSPVLKNKALLSNEVRALMVDANENVWAASKEGRLTLYDKENNIIGYLNKNGQVNNDGKDFKGLAYCMATAPNGDVWLGTKGEGLFKLVPDKQAKALKYTIHKYVYDQNDLYSLSSNNIYHLYFDSKDRLWVATFGGGINLVAENEKSQTVFINHRNNLNGYPINDCYRTRYITSDFNNNICVGATNGLIVFNEDFVEPESIYFRHYTYKAGDSTCLSNNDVHYITVTSKREIFLATFGGGLNKVISHPDSFDWNFKSYTKEDGLSSDVLLSMIEDAGGKMWIATENGLSKFHPNVERFENYGESEMGFPVNFAEAAVVKKANDQIFFGTKNGFIYFNPDSISKSHYEPPLVFTELKLFNKEVQPLATSTILKRNIDYAKAVTFKHNQNVFSIEYAALEMSNPNNIEYSYRLEGFEKEWNYVGNKRVANYTNIPHGEYVLKVKSTNADGIWCNNLRSLPIVIKPSFWETYWAFSIYLLIFVLVLGGTIYFMFTIYRLRNKVELETQLSDLKLNFFTDISHELRTPLTLITGPLEHVLNDNDLSDDVREQLSVVEGNASRMLRLLNQILDFVKIRHKKMKMRVEKIELNSFLKKVMANFSLLANSNGITLELKTSQENVTLYADADKVEKIVFNLLSNAFKYISTGKEIRVEVEQTESFIALKVKDSGKGISEHKKKALFERFENLWQKNNMEQPSTGIGLSMVKDLVALHGGEIAFESEEGKGSEFTVSFPIGFEHFDDDVEMIISDADDHIEINNINENIKEKEEESEEQELVDRDTILVVEDNVEVRHFIRRVLKNSYRILEAENGREALVVAQKHIPDLIISDLMMPEMDGIEFLRHTRTDFSTSHIPFIILSAKSNIESQMQGFEKGADSYVTKPFSTKYLLARVENLLLQRKKLQQLYAGDRPKKRIEVKPDMPEITSMDQKFIDELMAIMENNMDNGSLVVDDLVKELAVSRSVFFKKLKSLTGMAPIEFIREVRLKRAAQLIQKSDHNMTQIAYMVGINDSRYFSKCFKQKFGVTPTKYRTQLSEE